MHNKHVCTRCYTVWLEYGLCEDDNENMWQYGDRWSHASLRKHYITDNCGLINHPNLPICDLRNRRDSLQFMIIMGLGVLSRLRGAIGSASDSRSEGCVFESRRGQCFRFLWRARTHPKRKTQAPVCWPQIWYLPSQHWCLVSWTLVPAAYWVHLYIHPVAPCKRNPYIDDFWPDTSMEKCFRQIENIEKITPTIWKHCLSREFTLWFIQ